MVTIRNTQRSYPVSIQQTTVALNAMLKHVGYPDFAIGVWFCSPATIRKYNTEFRNKRKVTDILSFPYHYELQPGERITVNEEEDKNIGDIIICLEQVAQRAPEYDRSYDEHFIALLAHGVAHLLGHDHHTDEEYELMNTLEQELIRVAQNATQ